MFAKSRLRDPGGVIIPRAGVRKPGRATFPTNMGEDLRGAFDQATLGTLQRRGPGSWIGTVSNQWQVFSCGQSVLALLRCAREGSRQHS